jgi:NUMOD4 motif
MFEEWRLIPSFPNYEVSSFGKVRNSRTKHHLKPQFIEGYLRVSLWNGKTINRRINCLVAEAFIGPKPVGNHAHHKDENTLNDYYENIEYLFYKKHYKHHQITNPNFYSNKLTAADVKEIRTLREKGLTYRKIADMKGVSEPLVHYIIKKKIWKYVPD